MLAIGIIAAVIVGFGDAGAGFSLGDHFAFEFDYVFPGYKDNILNAPSTDVEELLATQNA